jgi:amino acid transporter
VGLLVIVAGLTWFGHAGRLTFAVMTLLFIASAAAVLVHGFTHPVISHGHAPVTGPEGSPLAAVIFSFPVAMALATGTEAPSSAIAQLGQLDAAGRRRFARGTLALTFGIVAVRLTVAVVRVAPPGQRNGVILQSDKDAAYANRASPGCWILFSMAHVATWVRDRRPRVSRIRRT